MSSHFYATKRVFINLGSKDQKINLLQKLNKSTKRLKNFSEPPRLRENKQFMQQSNESYGG